MSKPGQRSLRASCLCPAPLEDLLQDCLLIPTGYLLPCPHNDTDSQRGPPFSLQVASLVTAGPGERAFFSSSCPTAQVFHGCLFHQHRNSRPAIAFPALSPIPGFRGACVPMYTDIHVEFNMPVWWAALKESYFRKWTRWWWRRRRGGGVLKNREFLPRQNAPKHDKVLPPDQKQ